MPHCNLEEITWEEEEPGVNEWAMRIALSSRWFCIYGYIEEYDEDQEEEPELEANLAPINSLISFYGFNPFLESPDVS